MVVLGGMGSITGAVLAAAILSRRCPRAPLRGSVRVSAIRAW